jgi:hypothetical protein
MIELAVITITARVTIAIMASSDIFSADDVVIPDRSMAF